MKHKLIFFAFIILILTGCGERGMQTVQESGEISIEESEEFGEVTDTEIVDEKPLWPTNIQGSVVQEDEDYFYLCSIYRIAKVDRANESCEILWHNGDEVVQAERFLYSEGAGVLLGDRLYFIEGWHDEDGKEQRALSVVTTDGTDYCRLISLTGYSGHVTVEGISLREGYLTIPTSTWEEEIEDKVFCYKVYEDGSFSEVMELTLLEGEPAYGEDKWLWAENDRYYLCSFEEEDRMLTLLDKETLEPRWTIPYPMNDSVRAMDDTYAYVEVWVGTHHVQYDKISLETGERSLFFEFPIMQASGLAPQFLMEPVVRNGYFYYLNSWEYGLYMMRRSVENPEQEEIVGDVIYDTGIANVGGIVGWSEVLYSESVPDKVIATVDLEWLQVNDEFPGAAKINAYLEECQNANYEYEKESVEWMHDMTEEEAQLFMLGYSYTSEVEKIHYFDGKYLSFCQSEYDYTGGAHGMPYRIGFTFDLETGELLTLADVIGNTEEELKETVAKYFAEMMKAHPEETFWDDSVEYIRDVTNLDSLFYLTEEGIVFYVGPYEISSYAAGFQEVTIPYSEFVIKIELDK